MLPTKRKRKVRKVPKRRSAAAQALGTRLYRPRVVPSKKHLVDCRTSPKGFDWMHVGPMPNEED